MPTKSKADPTRFSFQIPGVPARFSVVEFSVNRIYLFAVSIGRENDEQRRYTV
jgi:hypothetical protein